MGCDRKEESDHPLPPPYLVPRALFPGFGGGAPHLQSQGKAPWGRGCPPPFILSRTNWIFFYRRNQLLLGFPLNHQILQLFIFHFFGCTRSSFFIYKISNFFILPIYLFIWILRSIIEETKSNSMLKNNHFKQFCENSIAGYEFWQRSPFSGQEGFSTHPVDTVFGGRTRSSGRSKDLLLSSSFQHQGLSFPSE